MSFTSLQFWSFFAGFLVLYWMVREKRWQNIILLTVSYIFYGWVEPWLIVMLGGSTVIDYFLAKSIQDSPARKRSFTAISLVLNLGVLAFFKYYDFFSEDLARIAFSLGYQGNIFFTRLLLPAGLSFFTLKKLSYMIDVSRGTLQPTRSLVNFALYISFFPQIIAGPIERPQKLLPQIEAQRTWKVELLYSAWPLILMGLFKKIVIANSISPIIERIFHLEELSILLAVIGALGFTLQIFADFSAYTGISRGVSFLLGFNTSENFKSPYLALTPTDFWNRWHITLSTWLRDYIFFPVRRWLLRKQKQLPTLIVQAAPPIITMLLCGLWHGAGWTYLLWGGMYGILITVYQAIGMGGNWRAKNIVITGISWLVMFGFIVFGWLIFAAPSLAWIIKLFSSPILGSMEQQAVALAGFSLTLVYSLILIVKVLIDRYTNDDSFLRTAYYATATAAIFIYINSSSPDFIYFQF